jgi:hypothetical protein
MNGASVRSNIYVDDPALAIRGTKGQRHFAVATIIIVWRVMGFDLSFRKGEYGSKAHWIGCWAITARLRVTAGINEDKIVELRELLQEYIPANVIPLKTLRSIGGKANNMATLLHVWRPFLNEIWAAITLATNGDPSSNAPRNCVWMRQVLPAFLWLFAFLSEQRGAIIRTFTVAAYKCWGQTVSIITDASIWGFGAVLTIDSIPVAYIISILDKNDTETYGFASGDPEGQQTWECLTMLISLRAWKDYWQRERVVLQCKGDNMGMLHMLTSLKARGKGANLIAREIALDLSDASFQPNMVEHVPGIMNVAADELSRKFEPGRPFSLPAVLAAAKHTAVPLRTTSYYRTLMAALPHPA